MKFTCNKEELDKTLNFVSRVVTVRTNLPILSNLLLETEKGKVRILGTDLELAVAAEVSAQIEQQGSFTVPAKLFQDFIHQNPDSELEFELVGSELVCQSAQVKAKLPGLMADDFPTLPEVTPVQQITLPTKQLTEALKQVVIACAVDAGRPVLTGVYCALADEEVILAATDSFRLVEKKLTGIPVGAAQVILIPMRTIQELIRIAALLEKEEDVTLCLSEQQVVLRVGKVEIYSRLLTGNFPKYTGIIPKTFIANLKIKTDTLLQGLRLASIFAQAGVSNVLFEIETNGKLSLKSHGSMKGEAKHILEAKAEEGYKPIRVAFNARFLIDALSAAGSETVTLKFSGPASPLVLDTGDTNYLQLVMPIRLDN